ncbi:MAG TPA: hypothetical protein VEU33_49585 [Archangium sp.]|nr:hypothetical protein [Archangium sp.]
MKRGLAVSVLMLAFSVIGCGPGLEDMAPEAQGPELTQTEQPLWGYSVAPCPCTPNKIGQVMEADWSARSGHSQHDWVGIFPVGASQYSDHTWSYVYSTATSGRVRLQLSASLSPGQYELRYYLNDGFQLAATSAPFSVTY